MIGGDTRLARILHQPVAARESVSGSEYVRERYENRVANSNRVPLTLPLCQGWRRIHKPRR